MKDKKEREIFCNIEYFMKHKCNGCKLSRECEQWDNNRAKRDSSTIDDNSNNSNKSQ